MQSPTLSNSDPSAQNRQTLQQGLEQAMAACQSLKSTDQGVQAPLELLWQQMQATQVAFEGYTTALQQSEAASAIAAQPPAPSGAKPLPTVITRCQQLFEASMDAMMWLENGLFIDCNQAAAKMLGYDSQSDLLAVHPSELSPALQPDGQSSFEKANAIMALVLQQGSHRFEWVHQRANGELFWAEVLLTAINSDGRQLIHVTWRDISDRKTAEAGLHEQAQLLRSTYEGVDHSIVIIDVISEQDFQYVGWNPATEKNTGILSAAIVGKTPEEALGTEIGAQVRQRYEQCVITGTAITYEEFLPLDGQDHWWLTTLNPLKDASGRIYRIVLTTFEISDRKATEAALQQQEYQYRSIFESINDGIFISDIETGRLITVNPATCKIHGYTYEEFIQLSPTDFIHPDSLPVFADFVETIKYGNRFFSEAVDVHKDGTPIYIEVVGTPFSYGGEPHALAVIRDISDRKRLEVERETVEATLKERNTLLNSVLEAIPGVFFVKDSEGKYIVANSNLAKSLGKSTIDVIGKTDRELFPAEVANSILEKDRTLIEQAIVQQFEEVIPTPTGDRTYLTVKTPFLSAEGDVAGIIGLSRDISDRKRLEAEQQEAETELKDANSFLTSVLEAIPGFFFAKDGDGKYITLNSNLADFYHHSIAEAIGKTDFDFFPAEIAESMIKNDREIMAQGVLKRFEEVVPISTSETATYLSTKAPLRNAEGDMVGMIGLAQDISDLKAMEASLRQSEQRFRDVTEAAGEYIWEFSLDGIYTFVTEQAKAVKGYSPDELLGHNPFEFMAPEDVPYVQDVVQKAAIDKSAFTLEHRDITPTGEVTWEAVSGVPILDEQGDVIGFRGTGLSITDRKLAELKVAESEAKFRRLVEDANDMIYIVDADNRFTYLSPQFTKMWGHSIESCINQPFAPLVHPDDLSSVITRIETLYTTGKRQSSIEFRTRHRDGTFFWVVCSITPIKNEQGQAIGFQGVARDITERKQAEMAIAESEAKFRRLVENANDLLYEIDPNGHFNYLSPQLTKIWGYDVNDLLGKSFAPLVHPDDLPAVMESTQKLFVTGKRQTGLEFRIRHQDGHWIWVICNSSPIHNADKQVTGFQGIARDISDRKLAEAAIAESGAKFRRLVENSNDLIYAIDADYCFTYISPQFIEMWGHSVEEFMHQSFAPLIHPDDMPIAIDSIQTLFATGERQTEIELRTFHKDGTLFWITCSNIPVKNDQGQVIGWQGTARDISERKAFEEAQSRLTAILDATTDFVGMSNMRGEQLYMNPAGHRMLELPKDLDITGHPLDTHIPEWAKPIVLNEGIPTAICDGTWQGEAALRTYAGREFPVSQVIIAHKGTDGEPKYLSTIIRDITAQKQSEAALQQKARELEQTLEELQRTQLQMIQSEKMSSLGQLVAGVAHEINNPVNFIHGNIAPMTEYTQDLIDLVELYQESYLSPPVDIEEKIEDIDLEFLKEDSLKILNSMQVGTGRIRQIVGSLKNFSRLDEAECKAADIHEGLNSTLLILENRIKATPERPAIQIEKDYGDLPLVNCYPGQLNQVFMNILANALDALEDRDRARSSEALKQQPSTIKIQTQRVGDNRVSIAISDNGPGIPEAVRQRIFDPFFTTKPVGKGTGMGMSISHQIITEKHGGQIQCLSQPGQGAEFVIQIPQRQNVLATAQS